MSGQFYAATNPETVLGLWYDFIRPLHNAYGFPVPRSIAVTRSSCQAASQQFNLREHNMPAPTPTPDEAVRLVTERRARNAAVMRAVRARQRAERAAITGEPSPRDLTPADKLRKAWNAVSGAERAVRSALLALEKGTDARASA